MSAAAVASHLAAVAREALVARNGQGESAAGQATTVDVRHQFQVVEERLNRTGYAVTVQVTLSANRREALEPYWATLATAWPSTTDLCHMPGVLRAIRQPVEGGGGDVERGRNVAGRDYTWMIWIQERGVHAGE